MKTDSWDKTNSSALVLRREVFERIDDRVRQLVLVLLGIPGSRLATPAR